MNAAQTVPTIGQRFELKNARPWSWNGRKGIEKVLLLCEVTAVAKSSFKYKAVEVLSEEDVLPDTALRGNVGQEAGGIAYFALPIWEANGTIVWRA